MKFVKFVVLFNNHLFPVVNIHALLRGLTVKLAAVEGVPLVIGYCFTFIFSKAGGLAAIEVEVESGYLACASAILSSRAVSMSEASLFGIGW